MIYSLLKVPPDYDRKNKKSNPGTDRKVPAFG